MSQPPDTYVHGHHPAVLRAHARRTAANSCAYLLPFLKADMRILDVGCGPGSITLDLASYVPRGSITGIDILSASGAIAEANKTAAAKGISNAEFVVGDTYALEYADGTFDVVHAHQVLQHLKDPVAALREMRRVTKSGGIVAVRDLADMLWYPDQAYPEIEEWLRLFEKVSKWTGGTYGTGKMLHSLARRAGFEKDRVEKSVGMWCYSTPEDVEWWCTTWAERIEGSEFKTNALSSGFATEDALKRLAAAWRRFANEEDAWFTLVHGEVLCKV